MPKKLLNRNDLKPLPKGFKRVLTKKTLKIPALTLVMMMLALGFSLSDADVMAYAATTNYQVQTFGSMVQAAAPTFSDYWYQDGAGNWKVADEDGNMITNAWLCDDAVPSNGKDIWYLIDANGNMVSAGLVQDQTGSIYSLETSHNGYYGMLRYQSGVYDGVYLDLESSHDGAFAKIKNQEGLAGLQGIYGLTQVNINNSNIVYTSSFAERASANVGNQTNINGQPHHSDENYDYYLVNGAYVAVRRKNPENTYKPSQEMLDEIDRLNDDTMGNWDITPFAD